MWRYQRSWRNNDDDNWRGGRSDDDWDYHRGDHYDLYGGRHQKNGHDARQRDDKDGQQRGDDYCRQRGDDDSSQRGDGPSGQEQTNNSSCPSQQQPAPSQEQAGAPPSGGSDGLAGILGGNALAIGEDTDANGVVQLSVVDYGAYAFLIGSAQFTSTAAGEVALTDANTSADVIGADFVFIFSFDTDVTADGISTSTSNMKVLAIDWANWSPPGGQIVVEGAVDVGIALAGPAEAYGFEEPSGGNLATVSAFAEATGDNTLSDTSTIALTVADEFSYVDALALTAIG